MNNDRRITENEYLMVHFIATYGSWVLSASTITLTMLGGYKYRYTWLFGLFSQALWLVWILVTEQYGFLPMNLCLWAAYTYNHYLWTKEPKESADPQG